MIQSAEVNRINSMFKKSDSTKTTETVKQYHFTNNNNNIGSNNKNNSGNNNKIDQTNMDQVATAITTGGVNSNSTSDQIKENIGNW